VAKMPTAMTTSRREKAREKETGERILETGEVRRSIGVR